MDLACIETVLHTIIHIVKMFLGIVRVVYDECTTETIAVLDTDVRVIPISSSLIGNFKFVQKRVVRSNGALSNESRSISPVGMFLE